MKTDFLHAALKYVSYNRYTILGTLVAVGSISLASCTFTAADPLTKQNVSKQELQDNLEAYAGSRQAQYGKLKASYEAELASMQESDAKTVAQYESAMAQVDRQEKFWTGVLSWVQNIPGVSGNPLIGGALGLAGSAFGVGAMADNRRKDKKLKTAKTA